MTVAELKKELKKYDDDIKVVVQYRDSGGDYWDHDDYLYLSERSEDGEAILVL